MSVKTNIPADDMQLLFFVLIMKLNDDDYAIVKLIPMPVLLYKSIANYCENCQKTFAKGICFSLRVMLIFRNLLLLRVSINLLRAVSADCKKLSA